jgi:hypothetical protein
MISMFEPLVSIIVQLCPHCSFFKIFFMPLELIIFPGFPVIPLNSISFPSQKKFQEKFLKIKSYRPQRL